MALGERFYARSDVGFATLFETTPAVLYECDAQNLSGVDLWLMIFNAIAIPPALTVPEYSFKIADGGSFSFAPPSGPNDTGRPFANGIMVAWQTTPIYAPDVGPFGDSTIYLAGRRTT